MGKMVPAHMCMYLSMLRFVKLMEEEANDEGEEDAFRVGTPDWVGAPHQQQTWYLWKNPGSFVPGRPYLGRLWEVGRQFF